MNRIHIALLVLVAVSLACSQTISTPVPTSFPTATRTATVSTTSTAAPATLQWTSKISQPAVNVREEPNGTVIDAVTVGTVVTVVQCVGNWCQIVKPAGWIWMGCISDNPNHLGCRAK